MSLQPTLTISLLKPIIIQHIHSKHIDKLIANKLQKRFVKLRLINYYTHMYTPSRARVHTMLTLAINNSLLVLLLIISLSLYPCALSASITSRLSIARAAANHIRGASLFTLCVHKKRENPALRGERQISYLWLQTENREYKYFVGARARGERRACASSQVRGRR